MDDQALAPLAARGGRPVRGEPVPGRAFRILTAFDPDHRLVPFCAPRAKV
jgi:hypothetical protein